MAPLAAATVSPTAFIASAALACLLAALLLFVTARHPATAVTSPLPTLNPPHPALHPE